MGESIHLYKYVTQMNPNINHNLITAILIFLPLFILWTQLIFSNHVRTVDLYELKCYWTIVKSTYWIIFNANICKLLLLEIQSLITPPNSQCHTYLKVTPSPTVAVAGGAESEPIAFCYATSIADSMTITLWS